MLTYRCAMCCWAGPDGAGNLKWSCLDEAVAKVWEELRISSVVYESYKSQMELLIE